MAPGLAPRPPPRALSDTLLDENACAWPVPVPEPRPEPRPEARWLKVGGARSAAKDNEVDDDDECALGRRLDADAAALPRPASDPDALAATAAMCGGREADGAACAVMLLEDRVP